jgi:hypothetical protein
MHKDEKSMSCHRTRSRRSSSISRRLRLAALAGLRQSRLPPWELQGVGMGTTCTPSACYARPVQGAPGRRKPKPGCLLRLLAVGVMRVCRSPATTPPRPPTTPTTPRPTPRSGSVFCEIPY